MTKRRWRPEEETAAAVAMLKNAFAQVDLSALNPPDEEEEARQDKEPPSPR